MSALNVNVALDPNQSVVVEACAGSGKTWLLVSRLVRLLLAGVKPGQILAITFTRKAAREIEERLRDALGLLASADDAAVLDYLAQRGLDEATARPLLPRARGLFEAYLRADPPLTIGTFHAWFARLLSAAPLDSPLAGRQLDESASSLFDEAWAGLAGDCAKDVEGDVAKSLLSLFSELGAFNTRKLLRKFMARQGEWQMWREMHGTTDDVLRSLPNLFGLSDRTPHEALTHAGMRAVILGLCPALEMGSATSIAKAGELRVALALGSDEDAYVAQLLAEVLLTKESTPRKTLIAAGTKKKLAIEDYTRFESNLAAAQTEAQAYREALLVENIVRANTHGLRVGDALLERMQELKRMRRAMDFNDLECEVDRLLADPATGAFVMARLDARYRHILLDEFQDTNPMQWRVLRAWLDAYGEGAGGNEPPKVFMVGDPKQSIYRFRRAEPRLFDAARDYFRVHLGAQEQSTDNTRRNAGAVVKAVNAVFADREGFRPQTTAREDWPGWVEVLPLIECSAGGLALDEERDGRDPLTDPVEAEEDDRRAQEAAQLVARLQAMQRCEAVCNADGSERPMGYGDVLVLTRSTKQLAPYEAALRAAGIPFISPGRGGLLATLEAQDVLALLRFLADPADALSLAHVLRCPVFDVSDACLLEVFSRDEDAWTRLCALADAGHVTLQAIRKTLTHWIELAHQLPTHDALDAIFHASDWRGRYKQRVPGAMWPGVQANLDALIALTLSVDAGRYPSLSRLVDELRRLSSDSEDDAPDEGLIALEGEGQPEAAGRVRIMTIHGAKGLEAPVVWLIGAHGRKRPMDGYDVMIDWPAGADKPEHFSLITTHKARGQVRDVIAGADEAAEAREQLNLLYVAMTRAQQVFIVSGIAMQRGENLESHYALLQAALAPVGGSMGMGLNEATQRSCAVVRNVNARAPSPAHRLNIGQRRSAVVMSEGQQFGLQLHAWLQFATEGAPQPNVPMEVQRAGEHILSRPKLTELFDVARVLRGGNEVSFAYPDGSIGRIDRWVETQDALWVLDYKSGTAADAPMAQYNAQLAGYRQALLPFANGKPIKALLIFTDGSDVEVV